LYFHTVKFSDRVPPSRSETVAYSLTAASPTTDAPVQLVVGEVCSALGRLGLWS
jgi:hypothetical protein